MGKMMGMAMGKMKGMAMGKMKGEAMGHQSSLFQNSQLATACR